MKTINSKIQQNALAISIICPIVGIAFEGLAFLIPSPKTDMEFLYLFTGCAFIPFLSLIGLFSSGKLISTTDAKPTKLLGILMLLLNIVVSALGVIYILVVGLVGTTGSY